MMRDVIAERMRTNNPTSMPGVQERITKKLRGRTFLARGGNGQATKQQMMLHTLSGLPMEHAISILDAVGHFKSLPTHYKVDLAEPSVRLAIEVDGKSHLTKKWKFLDARKTAILNFLGWQVLRFTNEEVDADPIGCLHRIQSTISTLKETKTISQAAF